MAAVVLTVVGELEVLLAPGAADGRLVSAVALPAATLPVALAVQAALGGDLVGGAVTTLLAIAIALYAAGRHVASPVSLAAAAALGAAIATTRAVSDPAAQRPRDVMLTFAAVATP
ncbi:MAG TPA: hypothetical protein VIL49_18700, partial [Capillimicrobium sp.]